MTNPEVTRYDNFGLITDESARTVLPTFDTGERGLAGFELSDIVETPGGIFIRKRPKFEMGEEAVKGFNFFMTQARKDEFLREHLPKTIMKGGAYFLQAKVNPQPGKENMAHKSNPSEFDSDQIDDPSVLNDIVNIANSGVKVFQASYGNPESGLEPELGWLPEVFNPGNYVFGRVDGDDEDNVYYVDCYPIMPVLPENVEVLVRDFNRMADEIAINKFGMPAVETLQRNGFNTLMPSLRDPELVKTEQAAAIYRRRADGRRVGGFAVPQVVTVHKAP